MSELRALSFSVTNVEGLPNATLNLGGKLKPGQGALYLIEGRNGEGKSSLLHGIAALSAKDHDPSLLRDGASESLVKMTYWDGEYAYEVSRAITPIEKGKLVIKGDGPGVPAKQLESWIKDMMGVGCGQNPLEFLCPNGKKADAAKRKERLDYLMKVLGISFSLAEVKTALNGAESNLVITDRPKANLDLPGINKLSRDLVAIRGPLTTRRDDAVAASEKWRVALAGRGEGVDHKTELRRLEGEQSRVNREQVDAIQDVQAKLRTYRETLDKTKTKADDDSTAAWKSLLDAARTGAEPTVDHVVKLGEYLKALSAASKKVSEVEERARTAVETCKEEHAKKLELKAGEIATAQAGIETQIQTDTIRQQMEECQQQAASLTATWEVVDAAVKNIEALKKSKLATMPETLKGLTVSDEDDVIIEGRPFDKWNRAEQYIWALKIGSIGTGELNLCLADEAEHLDDENLDKVRKGIVKSGLIVIMARRSAGPLRSDPPESLTLVA